ncbi:hypothetical protein EZV62_008148 [Acer yangbiense]|uniref:3-hydroxyacyl-CoA dehydrogenase NAD binding domain-containing protein n=1 Tax=Acer yangbiense TaxID=1000413 RepID=A0A5C7IBX8_9ROSI|nr:hypothetical protein EZV62_008148 [Acer yangbiense]
MAEIKTLAVVGSGQMGSGIAQLGAMYGLDVWLVDTDSDALLRATNSISSSIQRFVSKSHLSQAAGSDALRRLKCTSNLEDLHSADVIIEAIVESENVKKKLFSELDKIAKASAILASNTSSISITRLASATSRPRQVILGIDILAPFLFLAVFAREDSENQKLVAVLKKDSLQIDHQKLIAVLGFDVGCVIGMHFMNPPPIMKLVEIVRGADTSDETFSVTKALAERFGKIVICSQDYSGFIVNRILMPMINEAFFTLYTGVATKEDIDTGMKLGTNHPMGPLELADFIGLDVCLSIMGVLHVGLGDNKYAPCPLLVQYVDAGRLGRKRGIGVYDYRKVSELVKPTPRL